MRERALSHSLRTGTSDELSIRYAVVAVACLACDAKAALQEVQSEDTPIESVSSAEGLAARMVGEVSDENFVVDLERYLLNTQAAWRGAPCDAAVLACANAARDVAREYGRRQASAMRQALIRLYAARFREVMTEADVRAAEQYLASPDGAAFARGLQSLLIVDARSFQEMLSTFVIAGEERQGAIDAFYDRTQDLPRATWRVAPPPPQSR
jgi:hypothetical protein